MSLSSGTCLGPYEIVAPLGAGGMGEVYRARDTRLGRDVALKVLPGDFLESEEGKARFEREARALAALNHPNIAVIYSFEEIPGSPGSFGRHVLVQELLEGQTLREALAKGSLPLRKALDVGLQVAEGLAAAHGKGIVHRDVKPENIFLTKDGHAKLLDFGLARHDVTRHDPADTRSPTLAAVSEKGIVLGTVAYMSPEQLEGKEADSRTDLWALGCVLYEMATSKRAFEGMSQASLIAAILKEVPRPISELQPLTPPALERIVTRCLEKDPDERWQSARDLAFDLEGMTAGRAAAPAIAGGTVPLRRRLSAKTAAGIGLAAALLAAGFFLAGRLTERGPEPPTFRRLSFQRGFISNARFTPDGKGVLYSAAWDGHPPEVFETRTDLSTTRSLGLPGISLQSVSHTGELALRSRAEGFAWGYGPLAVVPSSGSAPRDLLEEVSFADWSPDGTTLAVVRRIGGEDRLEMPPGHVLARTSGWFGDARVSPDGRRIVFTEHFVVGDDRGSVVVVEVAGRKTTLTSEFTTVGGLAWSPDGREIWFSASPSESRRDLLGLNLNGRQRTVARFPSSIVLYDTAPDGRVLLASEREQSGIRGRSSAEDKERELGWLDFPWPRALSSDGRMLLLDDIGETAGPSYAVYLRSMDGSPPMRLGEGAGCALSPDGRWALAIRFGPPHRLVLIPTGSGETSSLPPGQIETYQSGKFLPDGRRVLFVGAERGRPQRTWVQELPGGLPTAVTPEGAVGVAPSPDGRWVAAVTRDSTLMLFPLQGGEPRPVAKLASREAVCQWSADGRTLFVSHEGSRLDVFGIDVESGKRQLWKTFEVPDPAGVRVSNFVVTRDARSYAYGYLRILDELYLVEGLK